MQEDKRFYIFRYIEKMNNWSFIALNSTLNTNNLDIGYSIREKWTSIDGKIYQLCSVLYGKSKAASMIHEAKTKSRIENIMAMRGTDIFILEDMDKNILCTVWKPLAIEMGFEISCGGVYSITALVEDTIPFNDLTSQIKKMLKLNITNVEIVSSITHCIS